MSHEKNSVDSPWFRCPPCFKREHSGPHRGQIIDNGHGLDNELADPSAPSSP